MIHILVLHLEDISRFGRSDKTNILVFSITGSGPCCSLMWAGLSVCTSPDVAPLFNSTAVGKQTMNKHMLDVTAQREMVG